METFRASLTRANTVFFDILAAVDDVSLARIAALLREWKAVDIVAADVQRSRAPVWVSIGAAIRAKWPDLI